ncbi:hypothetical protein CDAR_310651 [Caerostris darwini]|uniref:Uncharacterized protein n=1 Tax=Caerostris darwini TaxID=1538125 RepID=A0AAV4VKV7_9ARAC|nr:hypothetical protein CDAR_310651 [Caerostris darwini]
MLRNMLQGSRTSHFSAQFSETAEQRITLRCRGKDMLRKESFEAVGRRKWVVDLCEWEKRKRSLYSQLLRTDRYNCCPHHSLITELGGILSLPQKKSYASGCDTFVGWPILYDRQ